VNIEKESLHFSCFSLFLVSVHQEVVAFLEVFSNFSLFADFRPFFPKSCVSLPKRKDSGKLFYSSMVAHCFFARGDDESFLPLTASRSL
jgi:hypothetical protein